MGGLTTTICVGHPLEAARSETVALLTMHATLFKYGDHEGVEFKRSENWGHRSQCLSAEYFHRVRVRWGKYRPN